MVVRTHLIQIKLTLINFPQFFGCRFAANNNVSCRMVKIIGELLGYTDQQVDDFLKSMERYKHMPDVEYPFELPPALAAAPKKKGFEPHESRNHFIRPKASSFI